MQNQCSSNLIRKVSSSRMRKEHKEGYSKRWAETQLFSILTSGYNDFSNFVLKQYNEKNKSYVEFQHRIKMKPPLVDQSWRVGGITSLLFPTCLYGIHWENCHSPKCNSAVTRFHVVKLRKLSALWRRNSKQCCSFKQRQNSTQRKSQHLEEQPYKGKKNQTINIRPQQTTQNAKIACHQKANVEDSHWLGLLLGHCRCSFVEIFQEI